MNEGTPGGDGQVTQTQEASTIRARAGAHRRQRRGRRAGEAEVLRGLRLKLFAALLLRAIAQEQAEEGTEGVSPRHPNVARRLGLEPGSPELAIGERYLEEQGYIRASSPGEKGVPFVITELGWEDLGYRRSAEGWERKPWWKRMLGL